MGNQELIEKIFKLKEERQAVILAHNYQRGEVQDIADFVGDSLGLSQQAAKTGARVIVFCGVHFMAETAAMLSPDKVVLLPDRNAGCPMADMINAEQLREEKKKYPGSPVVCYVNSTAEVKAECDVCCTSSNSIKVVEWVEDGKPIIFIPDQYLGAYTASKTNKKLILWPGYCPTHMKIGADDIINLKKKHAHGEVLVHPECRPEVIAQADYALSTDGILKRARQSLAKEFIIGTELGITHRLKKENPEKIFIPASTHAVCPNMKLITLEKILWALERMEYHITVPQAIRERAVKAVNRMLEIV
ncbi:MAG: quinolinate synthase NadA [Thermodesulfobacteriota bacterium]|jgi:quinolinate synthase|nr:MAG: quinolinate synthase NadA [Thermodesulfobacteriota bacterium]